MPGSISTNGLYDWDISPEHLYKLYTANLAWSLFLTSTAIHAILLIASPIQAVYKWYRRASSDSDTAIPYLCGLIGSLLWLRYAIFIRDLKLILLQTYAVVMQILFINIMILYRSKRRKLLRTFLAIVVVMTLLFLYVSILSEEDGRKLVGRCASGAQIAGSLVCPYLIYKAISTKVIDFVPMAPVAFTWVMELHAIIYSIGINDFYMLVGFEFIFTYIFQLANTIFCCMDGCLLSMFFIYPTEKARAGKTSTTTTNTTTPTHTAHASRIPKLVQPVSVRKKHG